MPPPPPLTCCFPVAYPVLKRKDLDGGNSRRSVSRTAGSHSAKPSTYRDGGTSTISNSKDESSDEDEEKEDEDEDEDEYGVSGVALFCAVEDVFSAPFAASEPSSSSLLMNCRE